MLYSEVINCPPPPRRNIRGYRDLSWRTEHFRVQNITQSHLLPHPKPTKYTQRSMFYGQWHLEIVRGIKTHVILLNQTWQRIPYKERLMNYLRSLVIPVKVCPLAEDKEKGNGHWRGRIDTTTDFSLDLGFESINDNYTITIVNQNAFRFHLS